MTRPPPGLARLSELAMPFYLTHQQILVPIAAACSWVPYLSRETLRSDCWLKQHRNGIFSKGKHQSNY